MLTADGFRAIALALAETTEGGHFAHRDFRRAGKIFATLGYPGEAWGMVALSPEEQAVLAAAHPDVFVPAAGAWGRNGSTLVRLGAADADVVAAAMQLAWERAVPKPRAAAARKRAKR
jgi:hypothetical protein